MTTVAERAAKASYMREWNFRNRDRVLAQRRARYERNKTKILAACSEYRARPGVRERNIEYYREYHKKNRDMALALSLEYRANNKEKIRSMNRSYYERNANRVRQKNRERYLATKDEYIERARVWRRLNPDKVRQRQQIRRARQAGVHTEKVNPHWIYWRDRGVCGLCGGLVDWKDKSLDHRVPLSLGGPHMEWNVQLAHFSCNSKKGNRLAA